MVGWLSAEISGSLNKMLMFSKFQSRIQQRSAPQMSSLGITMYIAVVVLGSLLFFFVVLTIICLIRDARHRGQRHALGSMLYHAQQEVVYHRSQLQLHAALQNAEAHAETQVSMPIIRPLGVRNSFRSDNPFIRKDSTSSEVQTSFLNLRKNGRNYNHKAILSFAICAKNVIANAKKTLNCAIRWINIIMNATNSPSARKNIIGSCAICRTLFKRITKAHFLFFIAASIKTGTDSTTGAARTGTTGTETGT